MNSNSGISFKKISACVCSICIAVSLCIPANNISAATETADSLKGDLLFSENFDDNILEGTAIGGTWTAADGTAITETGTGDAWYVLNRSANNFVYSADITLIEASAVGISFRSIDGNPSGNGYDFILDKTVGKAKLCMRPYTVIQEIDFDVVYNQTYHIDVVANGSLIQVYADSVLLIEANDTTYTGGKISLFGYMSKSAFDNVELYGIKAEPTIADTFKGDLLFSENFNENIPEGTAVGGTWTAADGTAITETGTGDAWYVLNAKANNFVYSADITLIEASAVGISFRSSDGNPWGNGYDFILDKTVSKAKLCMRPYTVIQEIDFNIAYNQTYHIDVVANGSLIQIYVDSVLLIEANDATYTNGKISLFGYMSKSAYDNVKLYGIKAEPTAADTYKGDLIYSEDFNNNEINGTAIGGQWYSDCGNAVTETGVGDAWYLLNAEATDFVYSSDITLNEGAAVGVSFRSDGNAAVNGYDFILDIGAGVAKICQRPYEIIEQINFDISLNRIYHIDIVVKGSDIQAYVDGVLLIEATHTAYTTGKISLYGYNSKSTFDNVKLYNYKAIPVKGDYNGDGNVNVLDIVRLKKYLAETTDDIVEENDIGGEGINAFDLVILKKFMLGVISI